MWTVVPEEKEALSRFHRLILGVRPVVECEKEASSWFHKLILGVRPVVECEKEASSWFHRLILGRRSVAVVPERSVVLVPQTDPWRVASCTLRASLSGTFLQTLPVIRGRMSKTSAWSLDELLCCHKEVSSLFHRLILGMQPVAVLSQGSVFPVPQTDPDRRVSAAARSLRASSQAGPHVLFSHCCLLPLGLVLGERECDSWPTTN